MIPLLHTGVATLGVVELPGEAYNLEIIGGSMLWYSKNKFYSNLEFIELPSGNWIILGWSDEMSQEHKNEIVGGEQGAYGMFHGWMWGHYNFETKRIDAGLTLDESYDSFLLSNGITNRVFIIKQVI